MTAEMQKALDDFIDIADELFFEYRSEVIPQVIEKYTALRGQLAQESVGKLRQYIKDNNIDLGTETTKGA